MSDKVTVYSKTSIRSLATVAKFLTSEGSPPSGQSDLVNKAVSTLADHIVAQELTEPVVSEKQAIKVLKNMGITWNRGSRGRDQIHKKLQGKPSVRQESQTKEFKQNIDDLDPDQVAKEAKKIRQQMEESKQDA